ncbi:hypothetical protein GCM10010199_41660 [Dactylosporangium roseum]
MDRSALDGLTAARALVDAIGSADRTGVAPATGEENDVRARMGADVHLGQSAGSDGSGEHGRVAAARERGR